MQLWVSLTSKPNLLFSVSSYSKKSKDRSAYWENYIYGAGMAFELLQKGIVLKLVGYRIILYTAKVEVFRCSTL